jgi:hypothetical protein
MPAEIQVGSVLAERYEVLAVLGQGALGTVYKAHDRLLDETVALKTVASGRAPLVIHTPGRARPRNVSRIHDYGQHEGTRFVSMEFVDGVDLRGGTRGPGLPPREACDVVLQLAGALAAGAAKADALHALSLVFYELVAGQPFAQNPAAAVPSALGAFLRRALARNPRDRYASAAEMVVALRECMARLSDAAGDGEPLRFEDSRDEKARPSDVETVVAMLATGLSEGDAPQRWRSALALAELGPAAFAAVPVLIDALDDSDLSVRQRAALALTRVGPAAVTPLLAAVRAPQEHVRFLAAKILTEIGSSAQSDPARPEAPPATSPESRQ